MIIPEFGLEIRPVREDEKEALLEVYRQCEDFLALGPVAQASMEMVEADLKLSASYGCVFCGIYSPAGKMIGVFDIASGYYQGDPAKAFLNLLMVSASHRGKGIGHAVVAAWEKLLREETQVRVILAGVQVNNEQAVKFWLREGFNITRGPLALPDGTTCYDLEKELLART